MKTHQKHNRHSARAQFAFNALRSLLCAFAVAGCGEDGDSKPAAGIYIESALPIDQLQLLMKVEQGDKRVVTEKSLPLHEGDLSQGYALSESLFESAPTEAQPLYLHIVGSVAGERVSIVDAVVDPSAYAGQSRQAIVLSELAAGCDKDGDSFLDCTNLRDKCCTAVPPESRAAFSDCVDNPSQLPVAAKRDAKNRDPISVHPFVLEESANNYSVCGNEIDDDCRGGDVACAANVDADGDGVFLAEDCNDADPAIPGVEIPGDGIDQNCDGLDGAGEDKDGDGYFADDPDPLLKDCDDTNDQVHPGAAEIVCNQTDEDCDGSDRCVDDDLDGDGYPASADCDDHNSAVHPNGVERCGDQIDQDCNGSDLPCAFNDRDGDGFASDAEDPSLRDCDDNNPRVYPKAAEICNDGIDQDCDGTDRTCSEGEDKDNDGYAVPDDCNDSDATIHPFAAELCDGIDNNCDGIADEYNPLTALNEQGELITSKASCGSNIGQCKEGPVVCSKGAFVELCTKPSAEVCNGLDDDCDGQTDEPDFGQTQLADEGVQTCGSEIERGECKRGLLYCKDGSLSDCRGGVSASAEICDGLDNDCDGITDNGADGSPLSEECFTGEASKKGVGACKAGRRTCVSGQFGSCIGEVLPKTETCNGEDDDCNGVIDDLPEIACYSVDQKFIGHGPCKAGARKCVSGEWSACLGEVLPDSEVCDGVDNDCDGVVDQLQEPCYSGDAATLGVGLCKSGVKVCVGGSFGACLLETVPTTEICDGLDNDCDGLVDEGFDLLNDKNHCGSCDRSCNEDQTCCGGVCSSLKDDQNCGACGSVCGAVADHCGLLADQSMGCLCGNQPACENGLRCVGGSCKCVEHRDCGDDALCCGGSCVPTSAETQCEACDDGGCDGERANACIGRRCYCGSITECMEGTRCMVSASDEDPESEEGKCLGCESDLDCGEDALCCSGACVPSSPVHQCEACGQGCDLDRADRCLTRGEDRIHYCACGEGPACDDGSFCSAGRCIECRHSQDCGGDKPSCVEGHCKACDPSDESSCGENKLCCNDICVAKDEDHCASCSDACNPLKANHCGSGNNGAQCQCGDQPACGDQLYCDGTECVACLNDDHCPNGVCISGVCQICDPSDHKGCGSDQLCCNTSGGLVCQETGDLSVPCESCNSYCGLNSDRCQNNLCRCGENYACSGDDAPYCVDGSCVECRHNGDCQGENKYCVEGECKACDPNDETSCGGTGLCCNFECVPLSTTVCLSCIEGCQSARADGCGLYNNQIQCLCGEGPACGEDQYCLGGSCLDCIENGDCKGENKYCVSGECKACNPAIESSCGENKLCCDFTCVDPSVDHCAACDDQCSLPQSNQCVAGENGSRCMCGTNSACGVGEFCNGESCVECLSSDDCQGENKYCVAGYCKACDPAIETSCGGIDLCCNFECVARSVEHCAACDDACNPDKTNLCGFADNRFQCLCGADAECGDGLFCIAGSCVACGTDHPCAGGELCCDGQCTEESASHCGACGQSCDPATSNECISGACKCHGDAECNGMTPHCGSNGCVQCLDPAQCNSDVADSCNDSGLCVCGNSGGPCTDGYCIDGECKTCRDAKDCDGGKLCCDHECVASDDQNCGTCGNVCESGKGSCNGTACKCGDGYPCNDGYCVENTCIECDDDHPCGDGKLCCGHRCVENDDQNCGTCGTVCESGKSSCNGTACKCGNDDPCNGDTPHCLTMDPASGTDDDPAVDRCVECLDGSHCASGKCTDNQCLLCDVANNQGCPANETCQLTGDPQTLACICGSGFELKDDQCVNKAPELTWIDPTPANTGFLYVRGSEEPLVILKPICKDELPNEKQATLPVEYEDMHPGNRQICSSFDDDGTRMTLNKDRLPERDISYYIVFTCSDGYSNAEVIETFVKIESH